MVDGASSSCANGGSYGSYIITDSSDGQWWRVDLGSSNTVGDVIVHHQSNCCTGQTKSSTIVVSATTDYSSGTTCGALLTDSTSTPETVSCDGAEGRYVFVVGDGSRVRLCEVEVYAGAQTHVYKYLLLKQIYSLLLFSFLSFFSSHKCCTHAHVHACIFTSVCLCVFIPM